MESKGNPFVKSWINSATVKSHKSTFFIDLPLIFVFTYDEYVVVAGEDIIGVDDVDAVDAVDAADADAVDAAGAVDAVDAADAAAAAAAVPFFLGINIYLYLNLNINMCKLYNYINIWLTLLLYIDNT